MQNVSSLETIPEPHSKQKLPPSSNSTIWASKDPTGWFIQPGDPPWLPPLLGAPPIQKERVDWKEFFWQQEKNLAAANAFPKPSFVIWRNHMYMMWQGGDVGHYGKVKRQDFHCQNNLHHTSSEELLKTKIARYRPDEMLWQQHPALWFPSPI